MRKVLAVVMRRTGFFIAALGIASVTASCEETSTTLVLAQVIEADDGVVLLDKGGQASAVHVGMTVRSGQTVETRENSHVIIALLPGIIVQLNPSTQLRVDSLLIRKSTHDLSYAMRQRAARLTLMRGHLLATTPATVTRDELEIVTPGGLLRAPEVSTLSAFVSADATRITATRGEVTLDLPADGRSLPVKAGEYLLVPPPSGESLQAKKSEGDERAVQEVGAASLLEAHAESLMDLIRAGQRARRAGTIAEKSLKFPEKRLD